MCQAISIVMSADGVWLPPMDRWEHSHSAIAKAAGLPDGQWGDRFARVEIIPKDGKYLVADGTAMRIPDDDGWKVELDEQRVPGWWADDQPAQRERALQAAIRWSKSFEVRFAPGGTASATGYSGTASATGDSGTASATGYRGTASATGDRGTASATGDRGTASATGYRGAASATGKEAVAVATGWGGIVRTGESGAVVCAERSDDGKLLRWVFGVVGDKWIKPNVWYRARRGKLVRVRKQDEAVVWAENQIQAAAPKGGAA